MTTISLMLAGSLLVSVASYPAGGQRLTASTTSINCSVVLDSTDQTGGTLLAGRGPNFITTSSPNDCCGMCVNYTEGKNICTTWIRQPSTGNCWLIKGGSPSNNVQDRTAGFIRSVPSPPTPPPPSPVSTPPRVFVESFGNDSIRIRLAYTDTPPDNVASAVMPLARDASISWLWGDLHSEEGNVITNGNIMAESTSTGGFKVTRVSDLVVLFESTNIQVANNSGGVEGYYQWNLTTKSNSSERIWGLGERTTADSVDNKGLNIDFRDSQHNTQITIPFAVSSSKYGVFFNNPGWGGIDLSNPDSTHWVAQQSMVLDFLVMTYPEVPDANTASPYGAILHRYYDAIGHPPVLPDWAMGFWASKQRYSSQSEIIDIVKNYTNHNITVDVLVIDWKHYDCAGDWGFTLNPSTCWPDPKTMVSSIKALGVQQVFVSLHPWSQFGSRTYDTMVSEKLGAMDVNHGIQDWSGWSLPTCTKLNSNTTQRPNVLYDVSNPVARQFLWQHLKQGYYDQGILNFWTDGTEPAGAPQGGLPEDMLFYSDKTGKLEWPSPSSFMYWPVWHSKTIYEGTKNASGGSSQSWSLARSAWAGSHLHNTIVWSGDISSDWSTLQKQIKAGINMQLVYPYWNTDTAGFAGGDWQTMGELIVRWFQFSIFTGVVRMHGSRSPKEPQLIPFDSVCDPTGSSGGPIEPWVYGPENISTLSGVKAALDIRRNMLPYLKEQVLLLSSEGQPFMRGAWFDFADDPTAETIEDAFMFGPDYYVAPVTEQGATNRSVTFPGSTGSVTFEHYFSGSKYNPGTYVVPLGPLDTFPLFKVIRS